MVVDKETPLKQVNMMPDDVQAVFDMLNFGCVSCMHAIERNGRRIDGVRDVHVDLAAKEVRVIYDGREDVLRKIPDLVRMLGHDVALRTTSANS